MECLRMDLNHDGYLDANERTHPPLQERALRATGSKRTVHGFDPVAREARSCTRELRSCRVRAGRGGFRPDNGRPGGREFPSARMSCRPGKLAGHTFIAVLHGAERGATT